LDFIYKSNKYYKVIILNIEEGHVGTLKYILRTGVLGTPLSREGEEERAIYGGGGQPRAPDQPRDPSPDSPLQYMS
jgi:hypothetical protein